MILSASGIDSTTYYPIANGNELPGEQFQYNTYSYWIVDFKKMPTDYLVYAGFGGYRDKFANPYGKRSGNTLYWYVNKLSGWQGTSVSSWQFNNPNWRYNYIAIG